MEEKDLDITLYNTYWLKLQQSKFDIAYFECHYSYCVKLIRRIKYIIIVVTTLSTGIWMGWNSNAVVNKSCPIVLVLVSVLSALKDDFPYEKRKNELRELSLELNNLYVRMESDWFKINRLECSNNKIEELLGYYQIELIHIKDHYLKDDSLPVKDLITTNATNKTVEYFEFLKKGA